MTNPWEDLSAPEELDAFCSRCRKITVVRVAGSVSGAVTDDMFEHVEGEDAGVGQPNYKIGFCIRCKLPFLFRTFRIHWEGLDASTTECELLFPRLAAEKNLPDGIPVSVERPFRSAITCMEAGEFEASAIMARKSIEALCRELGATRGTLQKRLAALSESDQIDRKLLRWADELRIIGNDAAHDIEAIVTHDDARDAVEFVEAILLYTFTLDQRFRAFQQRRKARP